MSDSAERLRRAMDVYEPRLKFNSSDVILGLNDESIRYSDVRAVLAQRDELLAACEAALAVMGDGFDVSRPGLRDQLRAAIANAKRGTK